MSDYIHQARQVITKTAYDTNFRFRLWTVIFDDISLIGEGYRQYHSRIISELYSARNLGWIFLNPNGVLLNIDALKADDIYGFLGKTKASPTGPSRHISSVKFRILDAYVQYKFPNIYKNLCSADILHDLAIPNIKFLHGWAADNSLADVPALLNQIAGVHVCMCDEKRAKTNSECYDAVHFSHHLIGLGIHHVAGMPYCVVHEFLIPLQDSFIKPENPVFQYIEWDRIKSIQEAHRVSEIFSGFAFAVDFDIKNKSVSLIAMLRERRTGIPRVRNLKISIDVYNKKGTIYLSYNDERLRKEKFYNITTHLHRCENNLFTKELCGKIASLHNDLGLEI